MVYSSESDFYRRIAGGDPETFARLADGEAPITNAWTNAEVEQIAREAGLTRDLRRLLPAPWRARRAGAVVLLESAVRLHVLTAVSRPENLGQIAESLAVAVERAEYGVDLAVALGMFDPDRQHVGGQALKNDMLDDIDDGWVWILDDDTLAHPDVLATVLTAAYYAVAPRRRGGISTTH